MRLVNLDPPWRGWVKHLTFPGAVTGLLLASGLPWLAAPFVLAGAFLLVLFASAMLDLPDKPLMTPELLRHAHMLLMIATWTVVFFTVGDRDVQLGFYETVAQIAPAIAGSDRRLGGLRPHTRRAVDGGADRPDRRVRRRRFAHSACLREAR